MDTNDNESINNAISYFAPKNRVCCAARSLENQIGLAIGMSSVGFRGYFIRPFKGLGVQLTPNVLHWLSVKDKKRVRRIAKSKTTAQKRVRQKQKFERLKELEAAAAMARQKRDGTHESGTNMANGSAKPRTNCKSRKCPLCKIEGHVTKRSKKCVHNEKNSNHDPNQPLPAADAAEPDPEEQAVSNGAADVDEMDCLPLTEGDIEGEVEMGEFEDCGTWDGGLDDAAMSVGEI